MCLALDWLTHACLHLSEHCLGNMEHARGARAVREARGIEELDARVATVAVRRLVFCVLLFPPSSVES